MNNVSLGIGFTEKMYDSLERAEGTPVVGPLFVSPVKTVITIWLFSLRQQARSSIIGFINR